MKKSDLGKLIASVAALFNFKLTADALDWYWTALGELDLEAVKRAVAAHVSDPEAGRFMPKPADVLRLYRPPTCATCQRIGAVVRDGEKLLPWSEDRAWRQGLQPEVCPDCRGRNRMYPPPPGLPDLNFREAGR